MAPNIEEKEPCILSAIEKDGIQIFDVNHMETHGTVTSLG